MIIERIYTDGLAQVAWIVGDPDAGVGVVIDPRRDPQIYVDFASKNGLKITATAETHVHADFVSGVIELQKLTGAEIYTSRLGETSFSHAALDDGDEINVGRARLRAFHTPGHTPEHLSYLLFEDGDASEPSGIFTGDALFVGEVGRPDLLGEEATEGLVKQLYNTIFERLSTLPDNLVVYPGHGAGSSCGRSIGSEPTTTIGQERLGNYAFRPRSLEEFRSAVMMDMPPAPTYYPILKKINKQGAQPLSGLEAGPGVDPERIQAAISSDDAVVIDARSPENYAAGFIPGTISIGAGGNFVNWVGWLAPHDKDVFLVMESDALYGELVTDLYRIGVDSVAGYLAGGIGSWTAAGRELDSYPVISVDELRSSIESGGAIQVVDVRAVSEWKLGHIDGAYHKYLGELIGEQNGLPSQTTLAFICGSGYRSNVAASVARLRGYRDVVNVDGGMDAWTKAGYPMKHS